MHHPISLHAARSSRPLSFVFAAIALSLAACGGGSGSSGSPSAQLPPPPPPPPAPPPPPPPPPAGSGPDFEATIPHQPILAGSLFTVEIPSSVRNAVVQQISGPTASEVENGSSSQSTWRAPELTTDTVDELVFEVTASDSSGNSSTVTVTADFRGFSGPGQPIALFEPSLELLAGTAGVPAQIGGNLNGGWTQVIGAINQIPGSANNPKRFVFFGGFMEGFSSFRISDEVVSDEVFLDSSFFQVGLLTFNLQGDAGSGLNFLLLDEAEDALRHFIQLGSSAPFEVVEAEAISITDPCYVAERVNTGQDFIWMGQRGGGVSVMRLLPLGDGQFDVEEIDSVGGTRSLCHILTTRLSDRIGAPQSNDDSTLSDLITVDFDTNELVLFSDLDEDANYDEVEVVPIDTQTARNLSIVDVFSRGTESQEPRYLAILLADNIIEGDHRVVVAAQDPDSREIVQTVYLLGEGIPIQMIDGPLIGEPAFDQFRRDIVVLTRDSGTYILEFLVGETTATPPSYAPPIWIDTGIGAGSAAVSRLSDVFNSFGEMVLLVAYPETGLVRQFRPSNSNAD